MTVPYQKMLQGHTELEYLSLEKHFNSLYNGVASLMVITEGDDLESDSQRLIHFGALCRRVSEIVEQHVDFKGSLSFNGHVDRSANANVGSPTIK